MTENGRQFFILQILSKAMYDSLSFDKSLILGKNKQQVIQVLETLDTGNQPKFSKSALKINIHTAQDTQRNNVLIYRPFVSTQLAAFFLDEDEKIRKAGINIDANHKLQYISQLLYVSDPYETSEEESMERIWSMINDIFKINEMTLEKRKVQIRAIFNLLRKPNVTSKLGNLTDAFLDKLISDFPNEITGSDESLAKVQFKSDKHDNYIIMYIASNAGAKPGSIIRINMGEKLKTDFKSPYGGEIPNLNLAVVNFPKKDLIIGEQKFTPLEAGIINCIQTFLGNSIN